MLSTPEKYEIDIVDAKMLELISTLQATGVIRYQQEFCDAIGLLKQQLHQIKMGKQKFTVTHVQKACELYNINVNWLFGYDDIMYRRKELPKQ